MVASRTSGIVAIVVAALSVSACSYDCGTERKTVATGTVRDAAGVTLATADVHLSDNLNPSFLRLSAGILGLPGSAGVPLRGHVTRARLVTEGGELLAEIPTSTATLYVDHVVVLNVDLSSEEEYGRVRSALLSARAKIIIDTDLAGREHIETTLTDAHDEPGQVGRCTPA
jgi:hypothetical protein